MEEDILFGKRRHLFGGLEPSNMRAFRVRNTEAGVAIEISLPTDTVIDGQTLCTVAGAIIRKSYTGYPKDEFDGELVVDAKSDGRYIDKTVVTGSICYYASFPYSDQGVYNRSSINSRAMYGPSSSDYIFGYDLDIDDPDPTTRVTYPPDVDNFEYNPAHMNFDSNEFDYGDWNITPGTKFMPKPCMLKYDGTVDHYLNPANYALCEDGVTASRVADTEFNGSAMMQWPKIYTKRWEENGVYHFRCSDVKHDSDWDCWCNYDKNDRVIPHFYTAIYNAFSPDFNNTPLRSISGVNASTNKQATVFFDFATAAGESWHLETLADRLLIQDLLVMMAHTTDCQTAYGNGPHYASIPTTGSTDNKGLFWGSLGIKNAVKVFGMENWWGGIGRLMAGLYSNKGILSVKITSGKHDGSTTVGYNSTGSGYITINSLAASSKHYIKDMHIKPFGRIPGDQAGSASEYECDYFGLQIVTNMLPYVGGGAVSTDEYMEYGPFSYDFSAGGASNHDGASISCKPSSK